MKVIYSSIRPELKRRLLFRGCAWAFPGFILLFFCGIYGSPAFLETWGLLIFVLGIGAVAWGFIPYRRVCRLETKPHRLVIENNSWTISLTKQHFLLDPAKIQSIQYLEQKNRYGIEILLNEKRLFFPFFSRSAYASLHDIMHSDESDESTLS